MPSYNGRELDSTDYRDGEILEWLYWGEGLSTHDIGSVFNITHQTVRKWMERNGVERRSRYEGAKRALSKPYAPLEMHDHGQMRWALYYGGDESYLKVSRLLAVSEFGFDAVCDKVVHHKNRIPWDDRPDNIELMTPSEHTKHHYENGDLF